MTKDETLARKQARRVKYAQTTIHHLTLKDS